MGRLVCLSTYRRILKNKIPMLFHEYVFFHRQNQGKTQNEIAVKACLDRSSVSRMENGEMPIHRDDAVMLTRALNMPELLDLYCSECVVCREKMKRTKRKPAL